MRRKYVVSWTKQNREKVTDQIYTADRISDLLKNLEEWNATDIKIVEYKEDPSISFVKRMEKDGVTYEWHVSLRNGGAATYANYEDGRMIGKEYPAEWLPKEVQEFIADHDEEEVLDDYDISGFKTFMYKFYN